ncbi:MAG: SET domain-containing protein [Candidatus Pacebacteria bacterium]|nr:SET domain-containing protein [Candidatus Paceibacterota bacterium]MCF7863099.1 SET domain-containing protein [Candidatus Paceibacterota bacterium]
MPEIIIGKGEIFGKGVYANRNFKKGEIVIHYRLKKLTDDDLENLSEEEKYSVHTHYGEKYLYSIPERYVNHSSNPNTTQDIKKGCDIAFRNIQKGEQITTNALKDDI